MSQISLICSPEKIGAETLNVAYVYRLDHTPHPAKLEVIEPGLLMICLPGRESLHLCFPWNIPEYGQVLISTGTLMRRERPYHLSVELARGLYLQVKNLAAEWESAHLDISHEAWSLFNKAGEYLRKAVFTTYEKKELDVEGEQYALESMKCSCQASHLMGQIFAQRIIKLRYAASLAELKNTTSQISDEMDDYAALMNAFLTPADYPLKAAESGLIGLKNEPVKSSVNTQIKWVGIRVDETELEEPVKELVLDTFNAVTIHLSWVNLAEKEEAWEAYQKQINWYHANGLFVTVGPLVNFDPLHIPKTVGKYRGNYGMICHFIREHVERVVKQLRGKVKQWIATTRMNSFFELGLTPQQQLELTAKVVCWIREFHPTATIITSVDQPWGDSLLQLSPQTSLLGAEELMLTPPPSEPLMMEADIVPPWVCAELLIRSRLGLSGLNLEFNVGYPLTGSYDRPLVEWCRMIDDWSRLGLPLYLTFRVPSSSAEDPCATLKALPYWNEWNVRMQAFWASSILPVLLAKPLVHGITWGSLRDYRPHDYPHAGLINSRGVVKRTQNILAQLCEKFNLENEDL